MWRKPAEAKPSSPASEPPISDSVKPQATVPAASTIATPVVTPAVAAVSLPVKSAVEAVPTPIKASTAAQTISTSATRSVSHISSGIRIKGEISGNEDLYIDGPAEGQFRFAQSKVTVGPNGRLKANIEARDIVIEGTVQGNLKASESVRLGGTSQVQGSLITPRISIDDGARLRGKVEMTRVGESKNEAGVGKSSSAEPVETARSTEQAAARAAGE